MILITQLIYLNDGHEKIFDEFEEVAIPAIQRYNGKLLLRVRPTSASVIDQTIEKPYEIHLVEFETEKDFEDFKQDETRKKFLHLKDQSVKASVLVVGQKI